METLDKNKLNKHENKTVIEYCEDIINAQYYDLSKLKELNVIKAVYDENNVVKWYIDGFEQAYTTYRELRKGLEEYVWRLKNGQYYKKKELFEMLGKVISTEIPTIILTNKSSKKMIGKLMFRIISQVQKTQLNITGMINGKINYNEELQKAKWESLEERMRIFFNAPFWINEVMDHSVVEYKQYETSIKKKNVKNIIIDWYPNQKEKNEILAWGKDIGINVFFADIDLSKSFLSERPNFISSGDIFAESGKVIWFN